MKPGDLVKLKENPRLPGALTAIKFFKRLSDEVNDQHMLVISVHGNSISVLVNGYKKVVNSEFVEIVKL